MSLRKWPAWDVIPGLVCVKASKIWGIKMLLTPSHTILTGNLIKQQSLKTLGCIGLCVCVVWAYSAPNANVLKNWNHHHAQEKPMLGSLTHPCTSLFQRLPGFFFPTSPDMQTWRGDKDPFYIHRNEWEVALNPLQATYQVESCWVWLHDNQHQFKLCKMQKSLRISTEITSN